MLGLSCYAVLFAFLIPVCCAAQQPSTFRAEVSLVNVTAVVRSQQEHGKLNARNKYGIRTMHHLASLTGASDFDALATNLSEVFTQIGDELRSMYQLGYVSTNGHSRDGSFRKVTVRCKRPDSIVRAKSGYYAR